MIEVGEVGLAKARLDGAGGNKGGGRRRFALSGGEGGREGGREGGMDERMFQDQVGQSKSPSD